MSKTGGRFDFEDGGSYSGGWLEGKAHGYGVCTGPKGQGEYAGAWVQGFEESGVYTWPSGNTYSGEWQEGKRHGLGVEVRGHWVYRGDWSHGYKGRYGVRQSTLSCARYEGTWTNNLQDGYGVETYIDEAGAYQGQWLKGVRHGFGVRHSAPYGIAAQQRRRDHASMPSVINAVVDSDRRPPPPPQLPQLLPNDPPGTVTDRQRGGFVLTATSTTTTTTTMRTGRDEGGGGGRSLAERLRLRKGHSTGDLPEAIRSQRRSPLTRGGGGGGGGGGHGLSSLGGSADTGHGILGTNVDVIDPQVREVYMGEWKADKRSGFGVSERSDGLKYVGEWVNDRKHGYGVTTLKDGTKDEGKYKDNELVTSGHKRKLFTMSRTRLRDRVDAALVSAIRAAEVAQQKALIAVNRRRNARERAEESDRAAVKAQEDSTRARQEAFQYNEQAPDRVSHREFPVENETTPVSLGEEGGEGGGEGGHRSSSSCPDPLPEEEEDDGGGGGGGGGSSNGVVSVVEDDDRQRRRRRRRLSRQREEEDSASSDAVEADRRAPVPSSGGPNGVPSPHHPANRSRSVGTGGGGRDFGEAAQGKRSKTPDNRRNLESEGRHNRSHVTRQKSPRMLRSVLQMETNEKDLSDSAESGPPTLSFPKILLRPPSPTDPSFSSAREDDHSHQPPSIGRLPSPKEGGTPSASVLRLDGGRHDASSSRDPVNASNEEELRPKNAREETSVAGDRWRHFDRSSDHVTLGRFLRREFHRQLPTQPPPSFSSCSAFRPTGSSHSPHRRRHHHLSASQGQLYFDSNGQRTPENQRRRTTALLGNGGSPKRFVHQSVRRRETLPSISRYPPQLQQQQQQQPRSPTTTSRSQVRSQEGRPLLRSAAAGPPTEEEEAAALVFDGGGGGVGRRRRRMLLDDYQPPPPPPPRQQQQSIYGGGGGGRWERREPSPRPLQRFALDDARRRMTTVMHRRRREEEEEEEDFIAVTHMRRREREGQEEEEGRGGKLVIRLADVTAWCTDNQLILVLVALNLSLAAIFLNFLNHGASKN